jgi:ABC-2 type transport system permease protein
VSDAAVLSGLKWTELRNRVRLLGTQSRFKVAVIALFSAAFWLSLFELFRQGLRYIHSIAVGYDFHDLLGAMFYIFFFALTLMLVFSNAIIGYSSLFKSRETGFLLATPVRAESVFAYKFVESLAFSSWAFLFMGTPLLAAYGWLFGAPWHFYLGAGAFLAVYMFIPAALGALVAMLVTVYIPRTRRALVIGGSAAAILVLLVVVSRLLAVKGGHNVDLKLAIEIFESISFSRNPLLPSYWVSKGVITLADQKPAAAGFFLAVIAVNVVFLMSVTYVVSGHLMMRGWHVSQGIKSGKRYAERGAIDRFFSGLLFFVSRNVRLIVIKDVKGFIRDPVQWSQFLIFFGLLLFYFLNLRTFAYEERDNFWKNVIAQMNLLATALTLATFASRFIYPQLSLEGRRFWVIGMAPMEREKILFGKLSLSFSCSLLLSEGLILLSSTMLRTPPALAILHAVSLFGICLGLSGLAVGLGAIYPNFAEDNPSKIVGGFGGTLNLVLSLIFVLGVLAVEALPCFRYYGKMTQTGGEFRWSIVESMVAIAVISLVTCLVPMSLGLRAIKRLEV